MYKAALFFHDLFALTCEIDHIFNSYNLICNKISEYHEFYIIYTGVLKMNPVVFKHKQIRVNDLSIRFGLLSCKV